MAIITGPLFSLEAHGSLGDVITYARIGRTNYSKIHFSPANPRSDGQVRRRVMTKFITQLWGMFTEDLMENFAELGENWNLSRYHAYLKWNSIRWTADEMPNVYWPIGKTETFTKTVFTATRSGILWTIVLTGSKTGSAHLCARFQATTSPAQVWNNLKTILILGPPSSVGGGNFEYRGTWLAPDPGTFYFGAKVGGMNGDVTQAVWP